MKNLYVCEYNDSYTGGGIVVICKPEELETMLASGEENLKLVTDVENNLRYRLTHLDTNTVDGVEKHILIGTIRATFDESEEEDLFGERVINLIDTFFKDSQMVRVDWLILYGKLECKPGIYIVYQMEVQDNLPSVIISNTFYSG